MRRCRRKTKNPEFAWQAVGVYPRVPPRAGRIDAQPSTHYDEASYDDFDLWLALAGCSTVHMLGHSYPFDAGTSLLLPPGVRIAQDIGAKFCFRMAFLHFDLSVGSRIVRDARHCVRATDSPVLRLPGIPALPLFATLDTPKAANSLSAGLRRFDDSAQLQMASVLLQVLAEMRRQLIRLEGQGTASASVVDATLKYLEENLHRPVFVSELARHNRMSPTHLTRLFRVQLRASPMQSLTTMRMARARDLLRNPRLSIKEVAAASGLESVSFFTRVFRKQHGNPPTRYRVGIPKLP